MKCKTNIVMLPTPFKQWWGPGGVLKTIFRHSAGETNTMPAQTLITRRNRSHRRLQRGMGMAVTMLVMMGILTITLIGTAGQHGYKGVLGLTDNALQASTARTRATTSFNMAESGVQYTLAWLEETSKVHPPLGNGQAPTGWEFSTVNNRGVVTPDPSDPGTYFAVRIYPDQYNTDVNSPASNEKKYLIESIGVSGGQHSIVQAYVRQGSLAQYLVLLNSWNDPNNYWVSGLTTFDGPVHDNNIGADGHGANGNTQTPDGQPENILWTSKAGTSQMFTYAGDDAYSTSSPTGIAWWRDTPGGQQSPPQVIKNADGTTKTNEWLNVAAGGAESIHTGTPVVPFPTSSVLQQNAATGTPAPTLNATGVTLCPNGGIFVQGDVSEMALSATGTGNTTQVMTFTQGTTVQRVTVTPTAGTMLETLQSDGTWRKDASVSATSSKPSGTNGVVYVNGNIGAQGDPKTGGLHGQVADNLVSGGSVTHNNAMTITTPQDKSCNLDGSITYNTSRKVAVDANGNPKYIDVNGAPTKDPAKGTPVFVPEDQDPDFAGPAGKAGTLGLISNSVLVTKKNSTGADITNFEMDGTVLASGQYDADHFGDRPVGLWENLGGYLSNTVGTFGQFSDKTLQLEHGFNTQFNYDARMRNNPPPFFPTTGYTYSIVSWQQVAQPLE